MVFIVIGRAGSLSSVVTRKMFIVDSSAVYLSRGRLSHSMVRRSLLAEAHLKLARYSPSLPRSLTLVVARCIILLSRLVDDQFKLSNGWLAGTNATHFKQDTRKAWTVLIYYIRTGLHIIGVLRRKRFQQVCIYNKSRLKSFIRNILNNKVYKLITIAKFLIGSI